MAKKKKKPAERGRVGAQAGARREIVTPEGVPLSLALADRGDRAAAFLIDALIIAAVLIALLLLVVFASGAALTGGARGWTTSFVLLAVFAARNFYFIVFEIRWRGQTPGKRALKIRVTDRHGGPLTNDMVVARNLMREIEVFLPLGVLLVPEQVAANAPGWAQWAGSVWIVGLALVPFFNRDRLRIGDLVAGTMVVRAPRAVLMADIGGAAAERARRSQADRYEFAPEQLDVYGIYELQVLEDLLRREEQLGTREAMAAVAKKIRKKIGARAAPGEDDAAFLREFYAAQRAWLEGKLVLGTRRERKDG